MVLRESTMSMNFLELIKDEIGISVENQIKILVSLAILAVLWLIRYLVLKLVWRQTEDARTRYLWKRGISIFTTLTSIILISSVWISAFAQFGAFLGLLSAGLAIALKDLLTNMAGWIFINTRKPFQVGDRVEIDQIIGDIIDIRLFQFTVLEVGNWVHADQSTGRIIHIPNAMVFSRSQANYSRGFQYIWNEIPVLITFESNWKSAKEILEKIGLEHAEHLTNAAEKRIKEATKKYLITYTHLTPIVYTSVRDSGVLLTIRYLCDPRKRRASEHTIWENILDEFDRNPDIEFAYPTTRFYNHKIEGDS
jgi:small-conductance mechanosensitive channel